MRLMVFCSFCFTLVFSVTSHGFEYQFGGMINERFYAETHFYDVNTRNFDQNNTYNQLLLTPSVSFNNDSGFSGRFSVDIDYVHYFTDTDNDADDVDVDIDTAYLAAAGENFYLSIGWQYTEIGRGLIHANEEPGIFLEYKVNQNSYLKFHTALIDDHSPAGVVKMGYYPGYMERVELFTSIFSDQNDYFAQGLDLDNPQFPVVYHRSSGHLMWHGIEVETFLGDFYVSGIFVFSHGTLDFERVDTGAPGRPAKNRFSIDVRSYMADASINYNINKMVSTALFLYFESGDPNEQDGDSRRFYSLVPYHPRSSIFFSGGLDPFSEDTPSIRKVISAGVIAPGIQFDIEPVEKLAIRITGSLFLPENSPKGNRLWYGWEIDAGFSYSLTRSVSLRGEIGYFRQGDYFISQNGLKPDDATSFILGLDYTF